MSVDEIKKVKNVGGKVPLVICRFCFDQDGIEIPTSGGRTNAKEKREQEIVAKRKNFNEMVMAGKRAKRKEG